MVALGTRSRSSLGGFATPWHAVAKPPSELLLRVSGSMSLGIERRAEVALAEIGQDDDDELSGAVRPLRYLNGGVHRGAATDPAEDALFARQAARHGERVVARHLDDLVDDIDVQVAR